MPPAATISSALFAYLNLPKKSGKEVFSFSAEQGAIKEDYGTSYTITGSTPVKKNTQNAVYIEDGNNDYIDFGQPSNLDFGTDDFSMEFWIKLDRTNSNIRNIFSNNNVGTGSDGFVFGYNIADANSLKFGVAAGTSASYANIDVSSYDLSGSYVYYAKDAGLLFKNNLDGQAEPVQLTSNLPWGDNHTISKMVIYNDSRIALILENKDFYIFNEGEHDNYFRKLADNIEETHFSDDGKKVLFWSNNEVSVYFLRDQLSQPIRHEDEMYNVTRYSEPIKNVQWFKDYEHIIFNSGRWIKIIEIDIRDQANSMDLINTENKNPFVIYNNPLEKLYFIDTKNELSNLYSIDFPEKVTIFGVEVGG